MRSWPVLVVCLLVAGCADRAADDDVGPVVPDAAAPATGLELSNCRLNDFVAFFESSRLRPLVPPDYETGAYFGTHDPAMTGVVDVGLRAFECQADSAFGHDDQARIAASVGFLYEIPMKWGAYGATNLYLLELFVDTSSSPSVAAFLDASRIQYTEAAITLSDQATTIEAADLRYVVGPDVEAGPTAGAPVVSGRGFGWERWHHMQEGVPTWLDVLQPEGLGGQAYGTLEADGGVWEALAGPGNPPSAGTWAVLNHEATIDAWSAPDPLPYPRSIDEDYDMKGLSLLDCDGLEFQFQFPSDVVAATLPPGYQAGFSASSFPAPTAFAGLPLSRVDHDVLSCNGFIDGESQGRPTFAWTAVLLSSADGHEGEFLRDAYVLEWFADGMTNRLTALLAEGGFAVQPASITWVDNAMATVTSDEVQYSFTCGPDTSLSGNGLPGQRNHVVDGDAVWMDLDGVVWRHEPGSPSPWSANGGALSSLAFLEGLDGTANCSEIYGRFDVSFGSS
jgi:hypothetical protein